MFSPQFEFWASGVALFLLLFSPRAGRTEAFLSPDSSQTGGRFRPDRILIKLKAPVDPTGLATLHATQKAEVAQNFKQLGNIQALRLPKGQSIQAVLRNYELSGLVEYAEPDYWLRLAGVTPNDPRYLDGRLWALNNTGQDAGAAGADIEAPGGWELLTAASNIIVAVIDTGVRYTHEDLTTNMWVNPQDGSHGLNALAGSNDPNDDSGHGTLIAGILGAAGNNGRGIVGVAWQVQIMACKFADNLGGSVSDAIACIDYARTNGASIINASWGLYEFSSSLSNAIYEARRANIIVVAAAGNDALDIDVNPYYPASLDLDNIVAVAATTRTDEFYPFSNYGAATVDLAAPGHEIYSTYFLADDAYFIDHGSSMAGAYVSGTCALLRAQYPRESAQQIINRLLTSTDPLPSLAGLCMTGGRLNLRKALGQAAVSPAHLMALPLASAASFRLRLSGDPERCYVIQASSNLVNWTPVFTNLTAADGTFMFTDNQTSNSAQRFFRAASVP